MSDENSPVFEVNDIDYNRLGMKPVPALEIIFGTVLKRRTVRMQKELGPGDYIEALEKYGKINNEDTEGLVSVAFRTFWLDAAPVPTLRNREDVYSLLNRMGNDGLAAINRALRERAPPPVADDEEPDAAIMASVEN